MWTPRRVQCLPGFVQWLGTIEITLLEIASKSRCYSWLTIPLTATKDVFCFGFSPGSGIFHPLADARRPRTSASDPVHIENPPMHS